MNRGEDEPLEPSNGTLRTPISVVITADEKTYNCNEAITEKTMSTVEREAVASRAQNALDLAMSYAMDAQLSSASVAELVAWRAEKDRLHEERVKAERKRAEKERLARSVYNDRVARWATLDAQIAESFAGVDVRAFHRDAQLFGECDWTHVPLIGGEEAMEAQQAV
ncbi:hypothetical protein Pmar_PMAR026242 [Perkinsus marinus ATCC 50983]|uniref:Uncharacterized protein n=1 Tax=Perkinsus marinus (strain ATCC 50983 / TXsc) TaxID=423536 RepID=C5LI32_PERM5|nr:hypothetical protein Pmar_PMAR026242 [Perkinsus marinus ATCC 50983]EER03567.1 hypothetical protein Pmar_PMAR026242 [Perkinsus marinus ATCC 50983]|eukprot:XP_002771751.1 hypothetical protein Pmar_PMAR026242 [Perkinsus marinus ATCC 50983]